MERPIEEMLQTYLDGELPADEASALEARIATDDDARGRLEMLRAAKAALEETSVPAVLPDDIEKRVRRDLDDEPVPAPRGVRRRLVLWVGASVAAVAALLIAVVLIQSGGAPDPEPEPDREAKQPQEVTPSKDERFETGNEWMAFKVVREARPARLFDDVVFTVEARAEHPFGLLYLVPHGPRDSLEALAEHMVTKEILSPPKVGILPVALTASIRTPDGTEHEGRLAFPERPTLTPLHAKSESVSIRANMVSWTIPLSQILVRTCKALPYFAVTPDGKGGWVADQRKAYARLPGHRKRPKDATEPRWEPFFPDQPGRYLVKFHLHTLPARREYRWPQFEETLDAGVAFRVSGVVGEWSEPENGISIRLAAPKKVWGKAEVVPVALQIRNQAEQPRKYNVLGTTIAKIPQPYHFQFFRDGKAEPAEFHYPERDGFIFFGDYGLARHTPGTTRTVVVPLDRWRYGETSLTGAPGRFTLRCRFHFEPSLYRVDDSEMWMGKVDVPGLELEVKENGAAAEPKGARAR